MVGYRKQAHAKWRQFGGARFAAHDRVDPDTGSFLVSETLPRVRAGERDYAEAVTPVRRIIRERRIHKHNVVLIEATDSRLVSDAFDLAMADLIAAHAHELSAAPALPPGFHTAIQF